MSDGLMIFLAMVFVAVALLSQGLIVPVFSESRQMRKRLQSRLNEVEAESGEESFSSLLRQKYLRDLSPFERQLEDFPAMQYLARIIAQGGHKFLAYRVTLLAAVLAIVAAIVTWVMTRSIPFTFLGLAPDTVFRGTTAGCDRYGQTRITSRPSVLWCNQARCR
jgi:tight adherence protein B